MNIIEQNVEVLSITENPLYLIEKAGRICYKSKPQKQIEDDVIMLFSPVEEEGIQYSLKDYERQKAFIQMLIKSGHHSVLEHVSVSVLFTTDRGISHEIVRHRIASYSQESTRFCNYGKKGNGEINVIKPMFDTIENCPEMTETEWYASVQMAEAMYLKLTNQGVPPEHARSVLPSCLKTEIVMTANLRQWRHFFSLRLLGKTGRPHPQIKALALKLFPSFVGTETEPSILRPMFEDLLEDMECGF